MGQSLPLPANLCSSLSHRDVWTMTILPSSVQPRHDILFISVSGFVSLVLSARSSLNVMAATTGDQSGLQTMEPSQYIRRIRTHMGPAYGIVHFSPRPSQLCTRHCARSLHIPRFPSDFHRSLSSLAPPPSCTVSWPSPLQAFSPPNGLRSTNGETSPLHSRSARAVRRHRAHR